MNTTPGIPGARIRLSGRLILTIGIIAFVIFFCLGGFLLLASLGMQNLFGAADLAVDLTYPPTVNSGETFELTAAVRNIGEKDVTLSEIQVSKTLLEGLEVLGTDPPSAAAVDYEGRVGYPLSIPIPPGQTRSLTIVFRARLATDFSGDLRFLTGARSANAPVTIRVQSAGASVPPSAFTALPSLIPHGK